MEFQIKSNCLFVEHLAIYSLSAQAEKDATHIFLTHLNLFDWKVEMVIQLRSKGLYSVTMGTKVEPNSVVEKERYFNILDEGYGLLF